MKKTITFVFLFCALAASCDAQWKTAGFNLPILAFGKHDTSFFISDVALGSGEPHIVRSTLGDPTNWAEADGGIDFTNLNVTTFTSLGSYLFAGTTETGNNAKGVIYRSTDNGLSWKFIQANGPPATSGKYLFGNSFSSAYRSSDSGNNWQTLNCSEASSYAAIDAYIFAITNNGLMLSPDTGNTWSKISPPFTGSMTVMSSLLFITGNDSVTESTDSGGHWKSVPVDTAGELENVAILVTDGKHLFAGTQTGVLVSSDSGRTWHNGGEEGLPDRNILTLGVFDTLLFTQVQGARGQLYTAVRPISEMVPKDTPLSVMQTISLRDSIEIYPNPASGIVTILAGGTSVLGVSVLDVLGENVLDVPNLRNPELTLDMSKIPSGTYFFLINTDGGSVTRRVVVIK